MWRQGKAFSMSDKYCPGYIIAKSNIKANIINFLNSSEHFMPENHYLSIRNWLNVIVSFEINICFFLCSYSVLRNPFRFRFGIDLCIVDVDCGWKAGWFVSSLIRDWIGWASAAQWHINAAFAYYTFEVRRQETNKTRKCHCFAIDKLEFALQTLFLFSYFI